MQPADPHAPSLPRVEADRDTRGLVVLRASRLEALLDPFATLLDATWPDNPLQPQTVIAAHPGIKHWLTGALARRLGEGGIVANLDVVLPSTWLDRLAKARLGEQAVALPRYQRAQLRWNLFEWLGEAASVKGLTDPRVTRFLQPAQSDEAERARRRFQLADRLAKLYSQYLIYRPDWLKAWQGGQFHYASAARGDAALADTESQLLGPLWRHAVQRLGPHRAEIMQALVEGLHADAAERSAVHVFGVSHLAPAELQALRAYAQRALVALYVPDPCNEYWGVLDRPGTDIPGWRAQETQLMEAAAGGEWWRPQRHELLARWGRMGQHFFASLADGEVREDVRHGQDLSASEDGRRLHRLQDSVRRLDESRLTPTRTDAAAAQADDSLRVHACHTPLRELEVLRDVMLDARTQGIAPGEMLVMAPDIERYLPLLPAVFGVPGDARALVPYHLADVPTSRTHPLLQAFVRLLVLPTSRLTAPEILDLMALPEVSRRFGLDAEGLEALEALLAESRVAWSLDPAHRAGFGVPALAPHGWAWAMDRMIAGYLMSDVAGEARDALHLPDDTELLPMAGIAGAHAQAMAALDALLCGVQQILELSTRTLKASEWGERFDALADALLRVDTRDRAARDAWDMMKRMLRALQVETAAAGVDPELHWSVASERLLAGLQAVPERQAFLLGGATFCGMVPQRAIPFRFIAVLGLDEGEFPRSVQDGGLDLMTRLRRIGDRDQRDDDRYLLLETLMAARERLHLSFVGEGVNDGLPRNPAAPLAELMALLDRAEPDRAWQVRHPLQPFDTRYFDGQDARLFSFDARQQALSEPLPPTTEAASPAVAEPPRETLRLAEVQDFYRDPARYLVQRLGHVDLYGFARDRLPVQEPLDDRIHPLLSPARELFLREALPAWPGDAWRQPQAPDWLRLGGRMPEGRSQPAAWEHEQSQVDQLLAAADAEGLLANVDTGAEQAVVIDLPWQDAGGACRLSGRVEHVYPRHDGGWSLLAFALGREGLKAAREIDFARRVPWMLDWLVLRLATPAQQPVRLALLVQGQKGDPMAAAINAWDVALQAGQVSLDEVRTRLQGWLQAWQQAPAHPLRYFPRTSHAVWQAWQKSEGDAFAVQEALRHAWQDEARGERMRFPGYAQLLTQAESLAPGTPAAAELIAFACELGARLQMPAAGEAA